MASPRTDTPGGRIVVVSPHLDDGVLSLGAAIAAWVRGRAKVEVLTVLAGDPASAAAAGGWDARAGFRTEGEAARARRHEDQDACAILGATPVWLPFGDADYERHGDEASVRAAVLGATSDAEIVLLPGSPLTQPDHAWLARLLADAGLSVLGFYAEQPYTKRLHRAPASPEWLGNLVGASLRYELVQSTLADRVAKWRAIRRYSSQLRLLGMRRSPLRGPHTLLREELIAWVGDRPRARD